ncbi:nuclear transport factor 2 family protein [Bacteroidota bacterium]
MKKLTILTAILIAFCSCTQQAEAPVKELDETAKQTIEVVKKLIAAYEAEDMEAIKTLYAPGAVSVGPRHHDMDTVDAEMYKDMEAWFASVDSMKYDVITILYESGDEGDLAGDWALVWADVSWYSVKADKTLKVMWHSPMRIENGQVVYEVSYVNQWDLYEQMGAELKWDDDDEDDD